MRSLSKLTLLLTIILMDLLTGMEFDLFVPSFPDLQSYFHITPFWVETLLSMNFIGYCFSLFFVGALSDRYGRKKILLMGLLVFVCGGIFCLGSSSFYGLLVGRLLHGIGIAAPAILSFLIIADQYPVKEQQRFMALLNGVMNTAVGLAPLLGSYLTLYFHWQGNFVVLTLLGCLTLIMTQLFIPNYAPSIHHDSTQRLGYVALMKNKKLMLLVGHILLMIIPYWIFVGMSPLLYMKSLGVSLTHFGYYQGSLAIFFAMGCFLFSWLLPYLSTKTWLKSCAVIVGLSLFSIGLVSWLYPSNPLLITLSVMVFVISQIIPSTILFPICLNYVKEAKGQVSALIQGGRLIFCAMALQIAGFYYQGTFQMLGVMIMAVIALVLLTLGLVIGSWGNYQD